MDNGVVVQNIDYCPTPTAQCTNPITDPEQCLIDQDQAYCSGGVLLLPGRHNITIGVSQSLYTAGAAFVRLDSVCPKDVGATPCCQIDDSCVMTIYNVEPKKQL